jgi:glycosyltransferase involved in cell wall biosynthesis
MRIAMVSEYANPLAPLGGVDSGGQTLHVAGLSAALARAGHQVTVYTRRDSRRQPQRVAVAPGLTVQHVRAGPEARVPPDDLLPYVPQLEKRLSAEWERQRPDVVHAQSWLSGLAAVASAGSVGAPLVQTFHVLGTVQRRFQGPADTSPAERVALERELVARVAHTVATCSDEAFELIQMGMRRDHMTVVPGGVDSLQFSPAGPAAKRPRGQRLVAAGQLVPWKGFDAIIEALCRLPDLELVVAGGPPTVRTGGDAEVDRLLALARECHVDDRVRLLGPVPHAEMPSLLRSADAVVCAPWYEPLGTVPLEAMACGVPVVATAVGGLRDAIVDGVTGRLVPPRHPSALAAILRRMLADPVLCASYGVAGRDRVESRYGWDRIAMETCRIYNSVIARGAPVDASPPGADETADRTGSRAG